MNSSSLNNKKIAINTIFMYVRLFVSMAVGLYTSRIVLLTLGVSDYGLYNVVGGLLSMFTVISSSLSGATTRFFNAEMGNPDGNLNKCFNINLVLHICFALIVFILAEIGGIWYIYNKLNVDVGKLDDAMIIYQISVLTACVGIINGPYASLFYSFERFGFLTKFDIINVIIRLVCVLLLKYTGENALIFYSIIMSITTINAFIVYHYIAVKDWASIVRISFVRGWKYYREVLVFGTWNVLATVFMIFRSTGSDLIINNFFGTAVNGAFAISKTVNNYIVSFSSNFDSASGPQIIQSYSSGDFQRCTYLVNKMGRFSILLFLMIFFPLYIELDFILHLWLKEVPDGVLTFVRLNLILAAVSMTCGGLIQYINASGKIKWFKIEGAVIATFCLLCGYLLCKNGAPGYTMIIVFIIGDIINRIVQLILLKKILSFDVKSYIKNAYAPPALIALIMSILIYVYTKFIITGIFAKISAIVICFILTLLLIYFIGLNPREKNKLITYIKRRFIL